MGFKKIGDGEDKKEMTSGYSLYKQTETKEIFYRFTHVESRQGSGGKKKVALVAQRIGDRNCTSVQNKYKAIGIMEEAIRKGVVIIPGSGTHESNMEPFRDYVKRQLVIDGDVYRWRNRRPRKPISPNSFDKYRAAFVHNAYDYIPPALTLVMTREQDLVDLAEKMREATKVIRCKDEDGVEIEKEVPKHSEDVIRSCFEGMKLVCEYAKQIPKIIDVNPVRIGKGEAITFARPEPPHREILTRNEVVQLLDELKSRAENPMRGKYWERVYLAVKLGVYAGLREGEMLALTRNDIDFDARTIRVNKTFSQHHGKDIVSTPKTESSVRKVSIPDFLCDELKEYLALLYNNDPDERIFKCTKSTLTKHFRNYTELAGLKPITIHGLRHSHVSLLISKRYDIFEVSKRIGHKSVKTTQDTYGHLFDEVQKSIANDLDGMRRR